MTQDEMIELAREAGIRDIICDGKWGCLERFAKLVAAKEREIWPVEMKTMENQVNILTDELAECQRTWVGLTDEQIKQIEMSSSSKLSAIYIAEAQLKGVNGYAEENT